MRPPGGQLITDPPVTDPDTAFCNIFHVQTSPFLHVSGYPVLIIYNLIRHSASSHPRYILGYTYTMALNDAGGPVKESQFAYVVSAIACSIKMGTTENEC